MISCGLIEILNSISLFYEKHGRFRLNNGSGSSVAQAPQMFHDMLSKLKEFLLQSASRCVKVAKTNFRMFVAACCCHRETLSLA